MARIRKGSTPENPVLKEVKWTVAVYIRLSKEDLPASEGMADESASITEQRKILIEYIEKHFLDGYNIADIYCDDGLTGTDDTREEFQRMINDVYTGKVNCIICKTLSRAFRNYADQGRYLEEIFPRYGVRFISESNPHVDSYIHCDAIQNGMEIPINGLMNDRYAAKTSADIRRTFQAKRSRGEFIGAFAPYGYEKSPEHKNALVIDEDAAGVIRDIFQWYVYGDGISEGSLSKEGIAKKLNELGVPNPTRYKHNKGQRYRNPHAVSNDGMWLATSIGRMLKNKMYLGTMVQGKQRVISYKVHDSVSVPEEEWYQVENTHKAIVSREIFDLAQEITLRDTRAAPKRKKTYLFSGILRCADCGKSMTRRGSKAFVYYNCSTYKRKSKDKCTIHSMRLDVLESAVLACIRHQIELAEELSSLIDEVNRVPADQTRSPRLAHMLMLRRQELAKVEIISTDLYADWKMGDITQEQYRRMKVKFDAQEEQLRASIAHIEDEILSAEEELTNQDPFLQAFTKHKNITGLSQHVFAELIDCIYIHEGGPITIKFKLTDPYRQTVECIADNALETEV